MFSFLKNKNNRAFTHQNFISKISGGFTLIELLVVVAIIGVLASVVLSSLNTARAKGRDARRMSDLRQIRNALEMYYDDYGYYPPSGCGWDCNGYSTSYSASWDTLATSLTPYIKILPRDPTNSACNPWTDGCYSYSYGNVGRTAYTPQYDLTTQLEDFNSIYRCGVKGYRRYFDNSVNWCFAFGGGGSNQIYEASN